MERILFTLGALFGLLGVAFGAFGAHALQDRLSERMLDVFDTAVRYQMIHAVVMLGTALLLARTGSGWFAGAGIALVVGIVLFSGSLYTLSLTGIRGFGAVAPLGGTAFLVGWVLLLVGGWRMLSPGTTPW